MIEQEPNVIAVLEELLPYELDMLEGCFLRLHAREFLEQRRERRDGVSRNAWIESFWVHARNLYEFFANRRRPLTTGASFLRKNRFCARYGSRLHRREVGGFYRSHAAGRSR